MIIRLMIYSIYKDPYYDTKTKTMSITIDQKLNKKTGQIFLTHGRKWSYV